MQIVLRVFYLTTTPEGSHSSSGLAAKGSGRKQQEIEKQKEQLFSTYQAKMLHLCSNWSDLKQGTTFLLHIGMVTKYVESP